MFTLKHERLGTSFHELVLLNETSSHLGKTKTKIKVSIHVKGQNLVWDNLVPLFLVNEQPFFTLVAQKWVVALAIARATTHF